MCAELCLRTGLRLYAELRIALLYTVCTMHCLRVYAGSAAAAHAMVFEFRVRTVAQCMMHRVSHHAFALVRFSKLRTLDFAPNVVCAAGVNSLWCSHKEFLFLIEGINVFFVYDKKLPRALCLLNLLSINKQQVSISRCWLVKALHRRFRGIRHPDHLGHGASAPRSETAGSSALKARRSRGLPREARR